MFATSKLVVAPDWQPHLLAPRFGDLWTLPGDVVKRGKSVDVQRCQLGNRLVFLKRYWVTHPNQLASGITRGTLFGRSKVRREFDNLQRLRAWGLDAPAPVAWGEERCAGWLVRCFLVSEAVADPLPLDVFIRTHPRRELIDRLAVYVRRLHDHRFEHHDLYWRNIILTGAALDHFYLIDAHRGRCWRDHGERSRAHDLATLDAPAPGYFRRTERLRFLLRYLNQSRLDSAAKALARHTLALAEPMRDRQLARVRS